MRLPFLSPNDQAHLHRPLGWLRTPRNAGAAGVRCRAWFGVAAEPVLETCRAEARVIAWGEALIVHLNAEVERLGIGDYRPRVPGCVQELPHEVVLTDRFGTGQFDRTVQRLSE